MVVDQTAEPRRRLSAEDRRTAILEAAREVFARRGFHGGLTSEIASVAGCSEPMLYKHFPSKQALFAAVLEAAGEEMCLRVEALTARVRRPAAVARRRLPLAAQGAAGARDHAPADARRHPGRRQPGHPGGAGDDGQPHAQARGEGGRRPAGGRRRARRRRSRAGRVAVLRHRHLGRVPLRGLRRPRAQVVLAAPRDAARHCSRHQLQRRCPRDGGSPEPQVVDAVRHVLRPVHDHAGQHGRERGAAQHPEPSAHRPRRTSSGRSTPTSCRSPR